MQKVSYSLRRMFPGLTDEDLVKIQEGSNMLMLRKGKNLFVGGDAPRSVYAIANGCLKIVRENADGGSLIVRVVKSGEVLGLNEMVMGTNYVRTAVALRDSEIFAIDIRVLEEVLKTKPELLYHFLKTMSSEIGKLERRLEASMFKTAKSRVTGVLFELHGSFAEANTNTFEPPLSRRDIAEMADVAPETVSRVLADLKVGGVLDSQGPVFRVLDANAFAGEAEGARM
jgi:CRP/FNR family transcriptional regulator